MVKKGTIKSIKTFFKIIFQCVAPPLLYSLDYAFYVEFADLSLSFTHHWWKSFQQVCVN